MNKPFIKLLLFILLVLSVYFIWKISLRSPAPNDSQMINFTIPKNQSVKETINNLHKNGLIKNKITFFLLLRFTGQDKNIQAGQFALKRSYSAQTLATTLTHGTQDVWLKILEGWRLEETGEYIEKTLGLPKESYITHAKEGYMFPDSYLVPQNSDIILIVDLIETNYHQQVTEDILAKATSKGLDENQLLTLASILERETKSDNDRRLVAAIMLKRLKNSWPLQADATIQYGLGYDSVGKTWWKKGLTREDLNYDSPYNTYLNTGFPPSPIASPGLLSIKAVINSTDSDYWFYISDSQGKIHYAQTLEEHEENISKYLL